MDIDKPCTLDAELDVITLWHNLRGVSPIIGFCVRLAPSVANGQGKGQKTRQSLQNGCKKNPDDRLADLQPSRVRILQAAASEQHLLALSIALLRPTKDIIQPTIFQPGVVALPLPHRYLSFPLREDVISKLSKTDTLAAKTNSNQIVLIHMGL